MWGAFEKDGIRETRNYTPHYPEIKRPYIETMVKATARSFSGENDGYGRTEDPGVWLDHYENVCHANRWQRDVEMMTNCSLYLMGEAETWYSINKEWIRGGSETWKDYRRSFE
jgi:hypothetical protein